jgi:hypothetical protein
MQNPVLFRVTDRLSETGSDPLASNRRFLKLLLWGLSKKTTCCLLVYCTLSLLYSLQLPPANIQQMSEWSLGVHSNTPWRGRALRASCLLPIQYVLQWAVILTTLKCCFIILFKDLFLKDFFPFLVSFWTCLASSLTINTFFLSVSSGRTCQHISPVFL